MGSMHHVAHVYLGTRLLKLIANRVARPTLQALFYYAILYHLMKHKWIYTETQHTPNTYFIRKILY